MSSGRTSLATGALLVIATVLILVGPIGAASSGEPSAAASAAERWKPNARKAGKYARHRAGNVSFAVIGLGGGMRKYHADETAPLASVCKSMLLADRSQTLRPKLAAPEPAGRRPRSPT